MNTLVNPVRKLRWCVRFHPRYIFFTPHTWRGFLSCGVKIVLMMTLTVSLALPAYAQEKLWKELDAKVAVLYQQGQYSEAANVAKEALKVAKETFGSNHPNVATSMNILGLLYYSQGKYGKTEPLFKRALAIMERSLGKGHPNVATVLENIADLYMKTGREDEAKILEERAKGIRSRNQ